MYRTCPKLEGLTKTIIFLTRQINMEAFIARIEDIIME
jgi:hypothetical protein